MPETVFLDPQLVPAARHMIYTVAHVIFPSERSLAEDLVFFHENWPLHDMDDIQHNYFDNGGTFLAVLEKGQIIGTGAIRWLAPGVCELKRFWFLPEYHGSGLGGELLQRLMQIAREKGYDCMRLETSPRYQPRAYAFYHKFGFYDIPRYGDDPDDIGMEKRLG
jgi:ribosomal protein S18 acetylase RimI-like enzyme